jgi:hypothetical protein
MADSGAGGNTNVTIGGSVSGQVAVGNGITQIVTRITPEERQELVQRVDQLRQQVEAEAPPERKAEAIQQVAAIEHEILSPKPDLGKLQAVKRWFLDSLPKLAGAVGSVVVHPIVGKLVEATGEAMAQRWKEHVAAQGSP